MTAAPDVTEDRRADAASLVRGVSPVLEVPFTADGDVDVGEGAVELAGDRESDDAAADDRGGGVCHDDVP